MTLFERTVAVPITNFLTGLGWSPRMAKMAMWAVIILALGKVLNVKVRV